MVLKLNFTFMQIELENKMQIILLEGSCRQEKQYYVCRKEEMEIEEIFRRKTLTVSPSFYFFDTSDLTKQKIRYKTPKPISDYETSWLDYRNWVRQNVFVPDHIFSFFCS